jgi:putative transposase
MPSHKGPVLEPDRGWAIDSRMSPLVVAAVEIAVARRDGDVAPRAGMAGSMGQVGSAGDNAAMGSFFALLPRNVLDRRHRWETRDQLPIAIVTWIERTYRRRRRQLALGRLTPHRIRDDHDPTDGHRRLTQHVTSPQSLSPQDGAAQSRP